MKNYIKKIILIIISFAIFFVARNVFAASNSLYIESSCSIDNFTAESNSIEKGDYSTLSWNTSDCVSANIFPFIGPVNTSGKQKVYPNSTTTYSLMTHGINGSIQNKTVTIFVKEDKNCFIRDFYASSTTINDGDSVSLVWVTDYCTRVSISDVGTVPENGRKRVYPKGDTTYKITAYGNNGSKKTDYVEIYTKASNYNNTSCFINNFSASSTSIKRGDPVSLVWGTSNCDNVSISNIGGVSLYGSKVIYPETTTTYLMKANGDGSALKSIQIEVSEKEVVENTKINENYKQAKTPTIERVSIGGISIDSKEPPITLRIENSHWDIRVGDIIDYIISYKNISDSKISNLKIKIFIPKGVIVTSTPEGVYFEEDGTFYIAVKDLDPSEEGTIYLKAKMETMDLDIKEIITTAILTYPDKEGEEKNVVAYVLNNPKFNNSLGASAFWAKLFNFSLLGWLIVIILILFLVFLSRHFYHEKISRNKTVIGKVK